MIMLKLLSTATLTAVVLLAGIAFGQESIMISPQVTELELPPGGKKTFDVVVGNAGDAGDLIARIEVGPIEQNEAGDYKLASMDNTWSCASWITIDKTSATLRPGEWMPIRCEIKAPYNVSGGRYAAIKVLFGDPGGGAAPMSTRFQYVLASYVEVTISKGVATRKVDISNLEIVPVIGNKVLEDRYGKDAFFIVGDVTNTGNIATVGQATLRIRQQRGVHQREVPLGTGRGMVLPGAKVKYRSLFSSRPAPGVYTAEATLHYGGYKPSVAKMVFSITQDGEIKPGLVESVETVGLDVTPRDFDLRAGPGSRKTIGVTLRNVEDIPINVKTDVLPIVQRPDGRLAVSRTDDHLSCHEWMTIEPDSFQVLPNSRKRLRITLAVPEDATGSRYSRIAFIPESTTLSREAREESYRSDIFLTIMPDIQRSVEVTSFRTVTEGRFQPVNSTFRIHNTGNTHVDLQATVTLNSSSGPLLQEIRLLDKDTRILPGVTRTFTVTYEQGLESGNYTADLAVRAGGGSIEYANSSFRIY